MSTQEENFEIVVDDSRSADSRKRAIDELESANECDRLSALARRDDVERQYRERAVAGLAHPQCKGMLEELVENGDLPESLREQAEKLLRETPDDSGAGP